MQNWDSNSLAIKLNNYLEIHANCIKSSLAKAPKSRQRATSCQMRKPRGAKAWKCVNYTIVWLQENQKGQKRGRETGRKQN